jgi:murein DD-endopeptidase MepM/ murein hydrolase activator NlpD
MKLNPYCFILTTIFLAGCTSYVEPARPRSIGHGGIAHRVAPGETLFRIAQRYGVELEEIVRANRIHDASQIQAGQTLVIPGGRPASAPSSLRAAAPAEFIWPVLGRVIYAFGMRRGPTLNKGIDIQADPGTDVVASRDGVVSFIHENLPGFGKTIILDHGDGFATVYAYIDEILIHPGQTVSQRQVIGKVGTTGRAEVPALHFEIRRDQKPRNPFHYLP